MEEKKDEFSSRFRSIPYFRNISELFFLPDSNSKNRGFTLVELLVVIAIIGIMAGGLIMIIDPAGQLRRSRDGRRKADLKQIQAALELYRSDCGKYPDSLPSGSLTASCNGSSSVTYMQAVPTDPKSPTLDYSYVLTGNTYTLTACDETGASDKDPGVSGGSVSGCTSGYMIQYTNP